MLRRWGPFARCTAAITIIESSQVQLRRKKQKPYFKITSHLRRERRNCSANKSTFAEDALRSQHTYCQPPEHCSRIRIFRKFCIFIMFANKRKTFFTKKVNRFTLSMKIYCRLIQVNLCNVINNVGNNEITD